jgi:hypothetical protein
MWRYRKLGAFSVEGMTAPLLLLRDGTTDHLEEPAHAHAPRSATRRDPQSSRRTSRASLSSRSPVYRAWRRWLSGVRSKNSNCPTITGVCDLDLDAVNLLFQRLEMSQLLFQHPPLMLGKATLQGPLQLCPLLAQSALSIISHPAGIVLAFDHGVQHAPSRDPEQVRRYA